MVFYVDSQKSSSAEEIAFLLNMSQDNQSWYYSRLPVPDVTVNTRRGVYVTYEPAQNEQ